MSQGGQQERNRACLLLGGAPAESREGRRGHGAGVGWATASCRRYSRAESAVGQAYTCVLCSPFEAGGGSKVLASFSIAFGCLVARAGCLVPLLLGSGVHGRFSHGHG